jgi:hypothetical protein
MAIRELDRHGQVGLRESGFGVVSKIVESRRGRTYLSSRTISRPFFVAKREVFRRFVIAIPAPSL